MIKNDDLKMLLDSILFDINYMKLISNEDNIKILLEKTENDLNKILNDLDIKLDKNYLKRLVHTERVKYPYGTHENITLTHLYNKLKLDNCDLVKCNEEFIKYKKAFNGIK